MREKTTITLEDWLKKCKKYAEKEPWMVCDGYENRANDVPKWVGSCVETEEFADKDWRQSQYVLGVDHFMGANFKAENRTKSRDFER